MNSLHGGQSQRPHRHTSAAVALIISGSDCHSVIDGKRIDWSPWATTLTPALAVHSHHNEGKDRSLFLIVQDGGLYSSARTRSFEFAEHPSIKD